MKNDIDLEIALEHKEWVAQLSDEDFKQWEIDSANFAMAHIEMVESDIAGAMDKIQQDPHTIFNISTIGTCIESFGQIIQEYDYLGPIKMALGHDKELEIMHKIAGIAAEIEDGVERYLEEYKKKLSSEEGQSNNSKEVEK
jgi:hypothetical protein